jgi:hypothetical protein
MVTNDNPGHYDRAIAAGAAAILKLHAGERLVNKVFGRATPSHAAGLLLVMHAEAVHGRGPRPTLTALQRALGQHRTLAAFITLLRLIGFVSAEPVPHDRRQSHLVPSERMIEGLGQWLAHHLTCCEILGWLPAGSAEAVRADPDARMALIAEARPLITRSRAAMAGEGAAAWFDRFDCGDRIALILLDGHYRAAATGDAAFAFSSRAAATVIGVSHGHVRNVVNAAEGEGLLLQDRRRDQLRLSPRMIDDYARWFLAFWGWTAEAARAAGIRPRALTTSP